MNHWLMKSEPDVFGLAHLHARPKHTAPWDGVRNYQARNFLRDSMQPGDPVLFYHSSCEIPGVAGLAQVASPARPDPTQFDPKSDFHDPGSKPENPRWWLVDVRYVATFPTFVPRTTHRAPPPRQKKRRRAPGNRLSITPVSPAEFQTICQLGGFVK